MVKNKIGRTLKRTYKRDFGVRKNPLPKELEFLSGVPFYAITECLLPDSGQRQERVEILPDNLKKLAKSYKSEIELKKEKRRITRELKYARIDIKELECANSKLELANKQLMKNLEGDMPQIEPGLKSSVLIIEEKADKLRGLPVQGGSPGLGKKR